MSRLSAALALTLALAASCAAVPQSETYPTRYDIDLQSLLSDPTKVQGLLVCFLQEGNGEPCTEMGRKVKAVLPEVLTQDCHKCSPPQRVGLAKVVQFLAAKMPEQWKRLEAKFDPQSAYTKAHPELF